MWNMKPNESEFYRYWKIKLILLRVFNDWIEGQQIVDIVFSP